jgi:hypothetical protein
MDENTVNQIRAMFDERIQQLRAEWDVMEHGTIESAENLAAQGALLDLKWDIIEAAVNV